MHVEQTCFFWYLTVWNYCFELPFLFHGLIRRIKEKYEPQCSQACWLVVADYAPSQKCLQIYLRIPCPQSHFGSLQSPLGLQSLQKDFIQWSQSDHTWLFYFNLTEFHRLYINTAVPIDLGDSVLRFGVRIFVRVVRLG